MRRTPPLITLLAATLAAGALTPAVAQSSGQDEDKPVAGGGTLPAGWTARTDAGGDLKNVKFVVMEPGYHLTLGPATILYREKDRVNGSFHTLATFHQMKKLEHPEGYGLFYGGQSLEGKGQEYTYFLVRGDGKFIIKVRTGETLAEYTEGWMEHSAIKKAGPDGKTSNLLEIDAKSDPRRVGFKVNGKEVYWADPGLTELKGIVGLRVNHNLDVHIEGFDIHK
jgi:hypothetical protein